MPKQLTLTEDAQEDFDEAYNDYKKKKQGLETEFIRCIDAKISQLNRYPLHHQVIYNTHVRRALTSRFPFSIYFINEEELITVFAILHQRRSPESWKSRI